MAWRGILREFGVLPIRLDDFSIFGGGDVSRSIREAKKRRGAASLLVRDAGQRRRNVHFGHRRFCALYMAVEYSGVTIDGIDAAVSAVVCFSISFPSYC